MSSSSMLRKLFVGLFITMNMFMAGAVLLPQPVHAATAAECTGNSSIPLVPKWYKYIPHHYEGSTRSCIVDAEIPGSLPAILLVAFEIVLRVTGIVAVVFIIYGGFQYLISTGEPEKAKNARTTIVNALVGLMIAILSTAIVNLVGRNIG